MKLQLTETWEYHLHGKDSPKTYPVSLKKAREELRASSIEDVQVRKLSPRRFQLSFKTIYLGENQHGEPSFEHGSTRSVQIKGDKTTIAQLEETYRVATAPVHCSCEYNEDKPNSMKDYKGFVVYDTTDKELARFCSRTPEKDFKALHAYLEKLGRIALFSSSIDHFWMDRN